MLKEFVLAGFLLPALGNAQSIEPAAARVEPPAHTIGNIALPHKLPSLFETDVTLRSGYDPATAELQPPKSRPILEGAVIGFTAGFLAGAILSTLVDPGPDSILVGIVWGIPGAVVGAAIGAILGK